MWEDISDKTLLKWAFHAGSDAVLYTLLSYTLKEKYPQALVCTSWQISKPVVIDLVVS